MKNNYLNLIGLANRAGQCSFGEDLIITNIRKGNAKLVLLASDTGETTKKKLIDKCKYYNVPLIILEENRSQLAAAVGKSQRVAVAILDAGFAKKMKTVLGE